MKKEIDIQSLLRKNIRNLKPYSSARGEFEGKAEIYLDANESPYPNLLSLKLPYVSDEASFQPHSSNDEETARASTKEAMGSGCSPLNRYPDPLQRRLKSAIGQWLSIDPENLFLGCGSDEAIDLLFRSFCEPGKDKALICSPTYGMYTVSAEINGVELVDIPLNARFQPDLPAIEAAIDEYSPQLIFLCSPNNPTGNAMGKEEVEEILAATSGLVIIDEAYGDFAPRKSFLKDSEVWPNLVVLKTFSKAWGMAGLRLGMAITSPEIVSVLNKVKPPYNLSSLVQEVALSKILGGFPKDQIDELILERERFREALNNLEGVLEVFPSDSNFLLVRFEKAGEVFCKLREQGTIIRDRRSYVEDALRITVGTPVENQAVLHQLESLFIPNHSIH